MVDDAIVGLFRLGADVSFVAAKAQRLVECMSAEQGTGKERGAHRYRMEVREGPRSDLLMSPKRAIGRKHFDTILDDTASQDGHGRKGLRRRQRSSEGVWPNHRIVVKKEHVSNRPVELREAVVAISGEPSPRAGEVGDVPE
jgi:hypothetical protein